MCLFGTLSHLSQVKYLKFLALAETSLCGKFLGLWSWLIHGDNITFKQETAALQGIFLLPLNLTTGDINHTTVSAFWWGLTSCLVLFWYLSLRNSCRYSDPSVWRGSFIDEVRLLTAMKQYLKHIKRHFPWLDSRRFKLTQVLHLTTERCANALLHVLRGAQRVHLFVCYQTDRTLKVSIRSVCFFVVFFFYCSRAERETSKWNTPGLWGLMISTCSGFTGKLVNLSHTSNSSEFFSRTFTHPFTPSCKPAEMVITHNYWDLSMTKQRHFCLPLCHCWDFTL